jgi:hypothetical protein
VVPVSANDVLPSPSESINSDPATLESIFANSCARYPYLVPNSGALLYVNVYG